MDPRINLRQSFSNSTDNSDITGTSSVVDIAVLVVPCVLLLAGDVCNRCFDEVVMSRQNPMNFTMSS